MFYHSLERQMRRFSARKTQLRIVALLTCLLVCGPAQSLPDDRDQPIRITADTAIRDEKQARTILTELIDRLADQAMSANKKK